MASRSDMWRTIGVGAGAIYSSYLRQRHLHRRRCLGCAIITMGAHEHLVMNIRNLILRLYGLKGRSIHLLEGKSSECEKYYYHPLTHSYFCFSAFTANDFTQ